MESGWLVNSNLSNSEVSGPALPGRSYHSSPIARPPWRALLQGRKSTMPQGFGKACARAFSIAKAFTSRSTETAVFANVAQWLSLRTIGADCANWSDLDREGKGSNCDR